MDNKTLVERLEVLRNHVACLVKQVPDDWADAMVELRDDLTQAMEAAAALRATGEGELAAVAQEMRLRMSSAGQVADGPVYGGELIAWADRIEAAAPTPAEPLRAASCKTQRRRKTVADHVAVLRRLRDMEEGAVQDAIDHAIATCEQHAALVARLGEAERRADGLEEELDNCRDEIRVAGERE